MQKAISKYWPVFVLPTLLAFIIGFIWPFIWGVYLSFQRFTTVSKTTFVGFDNYIKVFQDSTFTHAFWFTAAFTVVSTVLINVFAFAIALALTRGIRGTNLFRTVYFMPNLIGGILLGYIWQILLNGVLANLGKPLLALDEHYGFIGLVILMCWQQIGYMMIIYVAGLQSVPGDLIEAAKIDGATGREILFKIKIPLVMPSITICTFLTLTNSFKLFDQNVALTGGEPANLGKPLLALDEHYGFIGLVILMCWQQIGYMMIIYVAGLQSVPGDLIEAAKIDGATGREILFKIKIPLVMPSITICTFLTLTNSFKLFDQNVALTGGEPANLSEMLALNIYSTFYGRSGAQWKGIGQAKAVVFFLIVVVISLVQLRFTRSKEVQS